MSVKREHVSNSSPLSQPRVFLAGAEISAPIQTNNLIFDDSNGAAKARNQGKIFQPLGSTPASAPAQRLTSPVSSAIFIPGEPVATPAAPVAPPPAPPALNVEPVVAQASAPVIQTLIPSVPPMALIVPTNPTLARTPTVSVIGGETSVEEEDLGDDTDLDDTDLDEDLDDDADLDGEDDEDADLKVEPTAKKVFDPDAASIDELRLFIATKDPTLDTKRRNQTQLRSLAKKFLA